MANGPVRTGFWARFDLLSFVGSTIQSVISNWATISSYIGGGALMGYLAHLQQVPPIWWGVSAFGGLILVATVRAITKWGRSRDAMARLYEASAATPSSFNRLQGEFVRQTIKVSDLIHPLGRPIEDKMFVDCEFHGPGLMMVSGCGFDGQMGGGHLEFIRVQSSIGTTTPNKAILSGCHLRNCRFYNVALGMTSESIESIRKQMGDKMIVMGE